MSVGLGFMGRMGFPARWVELVMDYALSFSYKVLLNGRPTRSFILTRGIKQGNPISPYLFVVF